MEKPEQIITDAELAKSFENTNFGDRSPRDIIKSCILKYACGYATGHTAYQICRELGLVKSTHFTLTRKGQDYLWAAFSDGTSY